TEPGAARRLRGAGGEVGQPGPSASGNDARQHLGHAAPELVELVVAEAGAAVEEAEVEGLVVDEGVLPVVVAEDVGVGGVDVAGALVGVGGGGQLAGAVEHAVAGGFGEGGGRRLGADGGAGQLVGAGERGPGDVGGRRIARVGGQVVEVLEEGVGMV